MGAIDGLSVGGTVSSIGGGFGREDMGLDIHNSEATNIIGEIWLKVGKNAHEDSLQMEEPKPDQSL